MKGYQISVNHEAYLVTIRRPDGTSICTLPLNCRTQAEQLLEELGLAKAEHEIWKRGFDCGYGAAMKMSGR